MSSAAQMTDPAAIRAFVFAGNARITLVSKRTGERFTYRVRTPREPSKVAEFVSVLTGPSNEGDYSYLGHYYSDDRDAGRFRHGAKSRITKDAPSAKAWAWFDAKVLRVDGAIPEQLEVWHEGRCGRCGRALTVPESVAAGIGPECAGRL
jgi:Family of unknown function (DUF6011)